MYPCTSPLLSTMASLFFTPSRESAIFQLLPLLEKENEPAIFTEPLSACKDEELSSKDKFQFAKSEGDIKEEIKMRVFIKVRIVD